MIYSLILSQAKANNERVFRFCHNHNIPMYYSSTDSIAVPTRCLSLMTELMDESELGKLKIEAQGDDAIFIAWGLYYINDHKWCAQSTDHNKVIEYCKQKQISIREYYNERLSSVAY